MQATGDGIIHRKTIEGLEEAPPLQPALQLTAAALRRLARLHARLEGAQAALQAAQQVVIHQQQALRDGLAEVLDEEGYDVARFNSDAQLNIDWRTGLLKLPAP